MIEQKSFKPYPQEMLPKGFKYPESYLKLSQSTESIIPDEELGFPWGFENYGTDGSEYAYQHRNRNGLPNEANNLIPFAHCCEWYAYFDGNDHSGNPRVFVVDLTDLHAHCWCKDFDEWLKDAINIAWYPS